MHFGSRLAFGPDGMLYVTLGERSDTPMRPQAQQLDSHLGKIAAHPPDGTRAAGQPVRRPGRRAARDLVARPPQRPGGAFDAQGRLWEVEHGTRGGDELNLIEKGKNYGWPLQAYGIEYSGAPIAGSAHGAAAGHRAAGLLLGSGDRAVGRAVLHGERVPGVARQPVRRRAGREAARAARDRATRVTGEEHLLADRSQRIRDVRQGPDGPLYIVTDEAAGELWKLVPRGSELVSWIAG